MQTHVQLIVLVYSLEIGTVCHCRFLHHIAGGLGERLDEVFPTLSQADSKQFQADREQWWRRFTDVFQFAQKIKPEFGYRVAIDGEPVSVMFIKPAQATAVDRAEESTSQRSTPTWSANMDRNWVRGPPVSEVTPAQRIVGLDPGCKAVFTTVVHTPLAHQTLHSPKPIRYKIVDV